MTSQAFVNSAKLDPTLRNPIPALANAFVGHLRRFWLRDRESRALARLTERQLRDIGLSQADIVLLKEPSPQQMREALNRSAFNMKID